MKIRKASRVLLFDEMGRIFLFKIEDNTVFKPGKPINTAFWVTPGGSLEGNEGFKDAVEREVWEETGIQEFKLGKWVWTREHLMNWKGEIILSHERYYVANVSHHEVSLSNLNKQEKEVYRSHRWWSLDDIKNSKDIFVPDRFPNLLAPIVKGDLPPAPIAIE